MKSFVKWISGLELMKRWGTDNELAVIDAMQAGLPVGEYLTDVGIRGEVGPLQAEEAIERLQCDGSGFTQPLNLKALIFKRSDVERYETEHSESFDNRPLEKKDQLAFGKMKKRESAHELKTEAAIDMAFYVAARFEDGKKTTHAEFIRVGLKKFKPKVIKADLERFWKRVPDRFKIMDGNKKTKG